MPEEKIIIKEFEAALKHQNKSDEQIEELFFKISKESSDEDRDWYIEVMVKFLEYHRPNLLHEIYKKVVKAYIEKVIA